MTDLAIAQYQRRKKAILVELRLRMLRQRYENDFLSFVEAAWPSIDSSTYQPCWAIDALCEHLQAVTEGEIRHLLANFPPRCGKTLITSVCYPAWTWARERENFRSGAEVKFLCGSYNHDLSLNNSNLTRRLLISPWYQRLWGHKFALKQDQNTKTKFDNTQGGSRLSTSVGGSLLGVGGDILLVDDPHNTDSVESEMERQTALRWWKELSTTRLNDPKQSSIVVIMQRLHEEDVSGKILSSEWSRDWTHLCIPMEYERARHCTTSIGWSDPREEEDDGALMWPARFGRTELARMKAELGPYMASGRLQQAPAPAKGGIFERQWWQVWESPDGKFPVVQHKIASLDGAYTEKEENDPSALTIWGTWLDEQGRKRFMLMSAWRKHLKFSGPPIEMRAGETEAQYKQRTQKDWGLIEWVADSCNRFKVDKLLIEAKGPGISAAQALQSRYGIQPWTVQLVPVKGDKVARALSVQPIFAQGQVYAPIRDWSEMVIDEMAFFPKGAHDDLTDSVTQAMSYMRTVGLAPTDIEDTFGAQEQVRHRGKQRALYPV